MLTGGLTVSNATQVQATIVDIVKEFEKIDVFVANAGKPHECLTFKSGGD